MDILGRNVGEVVTLSATTVAKWDTSPKCVAQILTLSTSNKLHTEDEVVVAEETIVAPSEAADVVVGATAIVSMMPSPCPASMLT